MCESCERRTHHRGMRGQRTVFTGRAPEPRDRAPLRRSLSLQPSCVHRHTQKLSAVEGLVEHSKREHSAVLGHLSRACAGPGEADRRMNLQPPRPWSTGRLCGGMRPGADFRHAGPSSRRDAG